MKAPRTNGPGGAPGGREQGGGGPGSAAADGAAAGDGASEHAHLPPWQWPETEWRRRVARVRGGASLKPRAWKDGARAAVAISFDSDHETCELCSGGASIGRLSAGEFGSRVGVPRVLAILEKAAVPATFFVPAVAALLHPEEQRGIVAAGHEIGLHGWINEPDSILTEAQERELHFRSAFTLERITGGRPVGMRTPAWDFSPSTLRIQRELGLLYDSSLMADEDPYELLADGVPSRIVEIPVARVRDDTPYFEQAASGEVRAQMTPEAVLAIFRREFDRAWEDGGLFQLTLHPHVIGYRSRAFILEELIAHIRTRPGVWFARHDEVARFVTEAR